MNLKKLLDAVNAAAEEVQRLLGVINDHLEAGENDEAVALQDELDAAKLAYDKANQLYLSVLNATTEEPDPARRVGLPGTTVQVVTDEADREIPNDREFFMAVKDAAYGQVDPRLLSRRVVDATGLSEGVPADGGYLLRQETNDRILERMYDVGEILSRVAADPVGANANGASYNAVDETSRVGGSRFGGVLGYWIGEGGTITPSRPKFRQLDLKLKKVAALCYATDEQIQDTVNLQSWLERVVPEELRFQAEDAIIEGDGVGKPLGILNAPSLVTVTRTDANLVQFADIVSMYSRRWAGVDDYVWLIHQDVGPQLDQLTLTVGSDVVPPRFVDYGRDGVMRMKNKEVLESEYCQTLGTKGDIMLASLSQYQTINKGMVQMASSIHVQFVTDEMAFRFIFRIDGEPTWHSALTPLHGSNTVSPFVVLSTAS